jgi:peroxiredoxin Q/BCP
MPRYGQPAPDFRLPATGGGEVTLAQFKGRSDVVLAFYCFDFGSI